MSDHLKTKPETLVEKVAKPRLLVCFAVAFVITILLIGGTSIPFIGECFTYNTIYPVKEKRDREKAEKEAQEAEAKKKKEQEEKAAAKKKAEEESARQKQAAEEKAKTAQALMDEKKKKAAAAPAAQPQGNAAGAQADDNTAIPVGGPAGLDFGTM